MNTTSKIKRWQVVTNCSSVKKRRDPVLSPSLSSRNLEELAKSWVGKLSKAKTLEKVIDTYGGRTFKEAISASQLVEAELSVISAGLGLVKADEKIPNYNLTISTGDGSISTWLRDRGLQSKDWWKALNHHLNKDSSISNLLIDASGVIFALPSSYLKLIQHELDSLCIEELERIYIITSEAGQLGLSKQLRQRCLPYDERLDGAINYQGTRNDFAQRALKHFVEEVDFKKLPLSESKSQVLSFLSKHKKPVLPTRTKASDKEIQKLIKTNWKTYEGKRDPLHRFLRDVALVSCEQKRFSTLWNEVREQKSKVN
jgi:hypothetical protein